MRSTVNDSNPTYRLTFNEAATTFIELKAGQGYTLERVVEDRVNHAMKSLIPIWQRYSWATPEDNPDPAYAKVNVATVNDKDKLVCDVCFTPSAMDILESQSVFDHITVNDLIQTRVNEEETVYLSPWVLSGSKLEEVKLVERVLG